MESFRTIKTAHPGWEKGCLGTDFVLSPDHAVFQSTFEQGRIKFQSFFPGFQREPVPGAVNAASCRCTSPRAVKIFSFNSSILPIFDEKAKKRGIVREREEKSKKRLISNWHYDKQRQYAGRFIFYQSFHTKLLIHSPYRVSIYQ